MGQFCATPQDEVGTTGSIPARNMDQNYKVGSLSSFAAPIDGNQKLSSYNIISAQKQNETTELNPAINPQPPSVSSNSTMSETPLHGEYALLIPSKNKKKERAPSYSKRSLNILIPKDDVDADKNPNF